MAVWAAECVAILICYWNLFLTVRPRGRKIVRLRKNVCTVNDTLRIMRNEHRMKVYVHWRTIVR